MSKIQHPVNICFDSTVFAVLNLAKLAHVCTHELDEIIEMPDNMTLGSLDDLSPEARYAAYLQYADFPKPDFIERMHNFHQRISHMAQVRIWTSNRLHERVGMLYLASLLAPNTTATYINYEQSGLRSPENAIEPERYLTCLTHEQVFDITYACAQWQQLVRENAYVRVLNNNCVRSLPEDAFDSIIYKTLLDAEPHQSLPELAYRAMHASAKQAGGLLSDDFFRHRILTLKAAGKVDFDA
ncbi:DUF1835 domain-containing protein [Collinsella sp. zg1085]|uniref:DUF3658 domain-containing protein n=1 Tax=Collinsella sp. zg1085 TaxID=2844380 RepID=UPI001C0CA007|nr:DUF3658 domain-containing protein [Collinsella sp. zg1085]QWT17171.1 DUF1835 domain-containing protein [Collinsella sp. zg1085]